MTLAAPSPDRPPATTRPPDTDAGDVLDQLADGYYEVDRAYRYRRVNAAGARRAGRSPDEMLGHHLLDLFPGIAGSDVHRAVGRAMTGGGPEHLGTYDAPRGRWAVTSVYPLPDGVAIVSHDITDRLDATERDRAFAAIVAAADDAIVTKTVDGTVTSWNPAAERLYGWTATDMVGQSIVRIVPPDKRNELAQILARLGRGERIDHHETARIAKDGRRIEVAVSISPLVDPRGRVTGAVKIGRDISARRAAEHQREEFIAAVCHDLKNPLGGIKANAQLLLRTLRRNDAPDPERLTRSLTAIDDAVTRMVGLLDDLTDAARLRAGAALELNPTLVDLVVLARRCVDDYQATTQIHALRLAEAATALVGLWDAARLERAIANLLTNAIKYSPGSGEITVGVAREQHADGTAWAVLTVRDCGLGIPAADLPHILRRFRRGGNVGAIAGTGVGLAGVAQIVEQHGGGITVESTEGVGTTVTIRLPLENSA